MLNVQLANYKLKFLYLIASLLLDFIFFEISGQVHRAYSGHLQNASKLGMGTKRVLL